MHDSPEHGMGGEADVATAPPALSDEIRRYYELGLEKARLTGSAMGRLEFQRTQELLLRYLPPPPAVILDVGGGPGAYTSWLSTLGYEVHLSDPISLHVSQAQMASAGDFLFNQRVSFETGDARHLHQPDETADVVLLMGPLYHLLEKEHRLWALREAYRVLRPGGLIAVAVISRFAMALHGLVSGHIDRDCWDVFQEALRSGEYKPGEHEHNFTTAYLHQPQELRRELANAAFLPDATFAVEGPAWLLPELATYVDDLGKGRILADLLHQVETEPSLLGVSYHLLAFGRKSS